MVMKNPFRLSPGTQIADYPRTAWEIDGERVADKTNSKPVRKWSIAKVVIHYPGNTKLGVDTPTHDDTVRHLRASNRYYQRSRGYSYGYNWVVDEAGRAYEIRGWTFANAANRPENSKSVSIQLKVNGQNAATDAQLKRANQLIADIRKTLGRDVPVVGHGDIRGTQCPGSGIRSQMARGLFSGKVAPVAPQPVQQPAAKPKPVPPMTLSVSVTRNSRGDDARWVQRALKQAGPAFDPGPIDGWFGRRTENAAKNYQRANSHTPDGWVGARTWATLRKHALAWAEAQ